MIRHVSVGATVSRCLKNCFSGALLVPSLIAVAFSAEPRSTVIKKESFDHDPGWEAHNNHIVPKKYPAIIQDFGYSQSQFAGQAAGELGGQVWRAAEPAYYADNITRKTLDDKLSASGTFSLKQSSGGSG